MTETITQVNSWLNGYVWGPPMLVLLMGTGLLLTILTGAVQFRHMGTALKEVLGKITKPATGEGNVSPFGAVATALASTVGVGNIAGVATAIVLGGPGALFWLWVSGLLGMCTKFAEIVVALHYRERDAAGVMRGGAMYSLKKQGLPWLATIFAALTAVAAFGIGNMVQANSVAQSLNTSFGVPAWATGVGLVVLSAAVILGGIKRIAAFAQVLVPFMAILYLAGGLAIIGIHIADVPEALSLVFNSAFNGAAATGGFAGASIIMAMRYGVARGLFSNEAGLGSAPLVHAAANTDHPVRQGLYGIFEVLVDTLLICTTTGLVIILSGLWSGGETGAALSLKAFEAGLPGQWGGLVVTSGLLDTHWMELLRRDGHRIPTRRKGRIAVPVCMARVHVSRSRRLAASRVGHRRYAQRTDGYSEPRVRASRDTSDPSAPEGILLKKAGIRTGEDLTSR
jgi:AGCS family alanine or glycine:cation symporter